MTRVRRVWMLLGIASLPSCGDGFESLPNIAVTQGRTVVFLGDSITAGYGLPRGAGYVEQLAGVLDAELVNAGKNGDTTGAALQRFDRDVAAADPAVVVVLLGGNDFLRRVPSQRAASDLRDVVERVVEIGAVPVVVGFEAGILGAGYTGYMEDVASATGALWIDDVLDDVLRSPALKLDQIHPNAEGHRLIAERLSPTLGALIEHIRAATNALPVQ